MKTPKHRYDAFVSHAVEDKLPIANELTDRLEKSGLKIWYSGRELRVGESVTDTILAGLRESRYGIVILSKNYISKRWPLREFDILASRKVDGRKVILPVLFEITAEELAQHDPSMADIYGIHASKGLDFVVAKLLEAIKEDSNNPNTAKSNRKTYTWIGISSCIMLLCSLAYYLIGSSGSERPTRTFVEQSVQNRIQDFQQQIEQDHQLDMQSLNGRATLLKEITDRYIAFKGLKSYYRNDYSFNNGYETINAKKNVGEALATDMDNLTPTNSYQFINPAFYLLKDGSEDGHRIVRYTILNTQQVEYSIGEIQQLDDSNQYRVRVTFTNNNIRLINVNLVFPVDTKDIKRHDMSIKGLLPVEYFLFERMPSGWSVTVSNH